MNDALRQSLARALLCLADDELILGHRDSEWCGNAPIVEEDIAFANIALDEIGHAVLWYEEIAHLRGQDRARYPDQLVYARSAEDFRCAQIVEYTRGDWAFSMLRQYLFDSAELLRLQSLRQSTYPALAQVAEKITREEIYHLRHTKSWVTRLGLGTEESNRRMQSALDHLWDPARQLLTPLPDEDRLAAEGLLPVSAPLQAAWEDQVKEHLQQAGLQLPDAGTTPSDRRQHTHQLEVLLLELQSVARSDPQAEW